MITIVTVLASINASKVNFSILFTVEWILDRARSTINIYSHCLCGVILEKIAVKNAYIDEDSLSIKSRTTNTTELIHAFDETQL